MLQDMSEALLGRLTSPSVRLAAQLETDPQVREAVRIAKDKTKYDKLLAPNVEALAKRRAKLADALTAAGVTDVEELLFPLLPLPGEAEKILPKL